MAEVFTSHSSFESDEDDNEDVKEKLEAPEKPALRKMGRISDVTEGGFDRS